MLSMLVLCPKDSIILSNVRDNLMELIYLSKIFKFALTDQDVCMLQIQEHLFNSYSCLFNNLDRVSLLQDRIFITYYLSEMLHKMDRKHECRETLAELESLVAIKPIAGT